MIDDLHSFALKRGVDLGEESIKRCPRCGALALEIDFNKGIAHCTKCGFEKRMIKWNKKSQELRE